VRLTTILLAAAGLGALIALSLAGGARAQTATQPGAKAPSGAVEPALPTPAERPDADAPACPVSADSLTLAGDGLIRSRAAVAQNRLNILAIGSSSIEGVGASKAELGFVPLLQSDLRERLPDVAVNVFNRGVGGETAHDTVNRLEAEIQRYQPDLVIWQVGTNDVLRARPWNDIAADIQRGESILARYNVDVLLIDPQRMPENAVNFPGKNPILGETARLIAVEGKRVGYAVQRRFEAMSGWSRLTRGGIGPDDIHMNDDGYACWASLTAEGLASAVRDTDQAPEHSDG
jgi:acyl-CoA thioesterase-1